MKAKSPPRDHLEDGLGFFLAKKNWLWGFTEAGVNTESSFVKGQKELLNQS
jgi:hypothetical protein